MISHKYKCIFIHIPRTAGTFTELLIDGKDWWVPKGYGSFRQEKHIIASQAKKIYKDYWDEYFKFSIIRNPWSRMVSMATNKTHSKFYGSYLKNGIIDVSEYKANYGYPVTIEFEKRFYERKNVINSKHLPQQVYGNFLDENIDFIARYENLETDLNIIFNEIKLKKNIKIRKPKSYTQYYNDQSVDQVRDLYKKDIEFFKYEFE